MPHGVGGDPGTTSITYISFCAIGSILGGVYIMIELLIVFYYVVLNSCIYWIMFKWRT